MFRVITFIILSKTFVAYNNGTVLVKHPSLIEFREKSDKANILNKKFETSVQRASRIEKEHKNALLEKIEYRDDDPLRKYFYRTR